MNRKIVADSSADLHSLAKIDYAHAPMIIHTTKKDYIDDDNLDLEGMIEDLLKNKGKTSSACPGVGDWLHAFGDADEIFVLAISSKLSGSYNSALLAKEEYEEQYPGRRVHVTDTLSAGPGMQLMAEKIMSLTESGADFDTICAELDSYNQHLQTFFVLESLTNLVNNGRISPAAAALSGILGIRLVGKLLDGTLAPMDKSRGAEKALLTVVNRMKEHGYKGGKVRIAHCLNENGAHKIADLLKREYHNISVDIHPVGGLCTYYIEKGGLLIGFEC